MSDEHDSATDWSALDLAGKLASIAGELTRFPKSERVGGRGGYAFAGVDAMSDAIRPMMAERGVVLYPSDVELIESTRYVRERVDRDSGAAFQTIEWRTVLRVRWTVSDGGESLPLVTIGEALDTSDKSANKAQTAARKYAMIQLFNVSTGDEPDHDAGRPGEHVNEPTARPPARPQPQRGHVLRPAQQRSSTPAARLPADDVREQLRSKLREWAGLVDDSTRTAMIEWLAAETRSAKSVVETWMRAMLVDDELPSWPPVLDVALTERLYDVLYRRVNELTNTSEGASA